MINFREESWLIINGNVSADKMATLLPDRNRWYSNPVLGLLYHRQIGTNASVSVDFNTAWKMRSGLLGFYHTHPFWASAYPSERDQQTMFSWVVALGKPLVCAIKCRHTLSAYLFWAGNFEWIKVRRMNLHLDNFDSSTTIVVGMPIIYYLYDETKLLRRAYEQETE